MDRRNQTAAERPNKGAIISAAKGIGKRLKVPRLKQRSKPRADVGQPPGSLQKDPQAHPTTLHALAYGPGQFEERILDGPEGILPLLNQWPVVWIIVEGLADIETIGRIGDLFHLHSLSLEDVIHTDQRPKLEDYDDHLFLVAPVAALGEELETRQLSMFLGKNYLLTFLEAPDPALTPILERIRHKRGRVRGENACYLAYALLDTLVDHYFPILDRYEAQTEELEEAIIRPEHNHLVTEIHQLRHDIRWIRRTIWPMQQVVDAMLHGPSPLIRKSTKVYLRDLQDHIIRVKERLDNLYEVCVAITDLYLSLSSHRMNEVMKVLTIVATIFIPLTFIAGVYGMNFEYMPELGWKWSYPAIWLLMLAVAGGLVYFMRRRNWL